jgi:hypothetical protein
MTATTLEFALMKCAQALLFAAFIAFLALCLGALFDRWEDSDHNARP